MKENLTKASDCAAFVRDDLQAAYSKALDAVDNAHDPAEFYHFSTEADMINKIVLGMSSKKYKKLHSVKNVRDNCTALELSQLDELQKADTFLIKMGVDYQGRKSQLENYFNKALIAA